MRTILIAGRGESAVRVARACRDAGLASVAVYADPADRAAVHVQAADRAVPLPGRTPAQTYLDPAQVLRAAAASGADALHPGYGPLAESAEFAQAVLDAGLTWIGAPPTALRRLGGKLSARRPPLTDGRSVSRNGSWTGPGTWRRNAWPTGTARSRSSPPGTARCSGAARRSSRRLRRRSCPMAWTHGCGRRPGPSCGRRAGSARRRVSSCSVPRACSPSSRPTPGCRSRTR